MKKILALLVIIAMVSVFIPGVLADEENGDPTHTPGISEVGPHSVNTEATINQGSGSPPFIKCKWEGTFGHHVGNCWKEDDLVAPGIQVDPECDGDQTIYFFAICTSPDGVDNIDHVYADVYHPDGTFKYQIELTNHIDSTHDPDNPNPVLDRFEAVNTNNPSIITYNPEQYNSKNVNYSEVWEEIYQQEADLWWGTAAINYCQPAGEYEVVVNAVDGNVWSEDLNNTFWYVPTVCVQYDFTNVDYGSVTVDVEKQTPGDTDMNDPTEPTVRNTGNVPLKFNISQDDMGLGMTGGVYNVRYGAKLGAIGTIIRYYPYELVTIPDTLPLCTKEKIDFLILITKADNGMTSASGSMDIFAMRDGWPPYATPTQFQG